jgi:hypothetical protein
LVQKTTEEEVEVPLLLVLQDSLQEVCLEEAAGLEEVLPLLTADLAVSAAEVLAVEALEGAGNVWTIRLKDFSIQKSRLNLLRYKITFIIYI